MGGGGIPHEALATSVVVLVYSAICLILSTSLTCLLWSFGERFTYVNNFSTFTAISTLASIIQQIHYAVDWNEIKNAQYEQAVRSLDHPALAFGGAAEKADIVLFYTQFYCYNVMALNILFWAVLLFTGSWNMRANWLGNWQNSIGPISKVFSVTFPIITVGVMQADSVTDNLPGFFIIANFTLLVSMLAGVVLMILTLFKYIKTRRLVMGSRNRGGWWASGGSKERRAPTISANVNVSQSGVTTSSGVRNALYDRSLIIRFCVGFTIMMFFVVAVIFFNFANLSKNTDLATSGGPNLDPSGAIADIAFFAPGVTASLVAFLVFGTTKSWRQYRDMVVGGCGIRTKILQRRSQRDLENGQKQQSLEFQRLPSLTRQPSEEERARGKELETRVRMFSVDAGGPMELTNYSSSIHAAGASNSSIRPPTRDSQTSTRVSPLKGGNPSYDSNAGTIGIARSDLVVQYDRGETPVSSERRFVAERLPTQQEYGMAL